MSTTPVAILGKPAKKNKLTNKSTLWVSHCSSWSWLETTAWTVPRSRRNHFIPSLSSISATTSRLSSLFGEAETWEAGLGFGRLTVCLVHLPQSPGPSSPPCWSRGPLQALGTVLESCHLVIDFVFQGFSKLFWFAELFGLLHPTTSLIHLEAFVNKFGVLSKYLGIC